MASKSIRARPLWPLAGAGADEVEGLLVERCKGCWSAWLRRELRCSASEAVLPLPVGRCRRCFRAEVEGALPSRRCWSAWPRHYQRALDLEAFCQPAAGRCWRAPLVEVGVFVGAALLGQPGHASHQKVPDSGGCRRWPGCCWPVELARSKVRAVAGNAVRCWLGLRPRHNTSARLERLPLAGCRSCGRGRVPASGAPKWRRAGRVSKVLAVSLATPHQCAGPRAPMPRRAERSRARSSWRQAGAMQVVLCCGY